MYSAMSTGLSIISAPRSSLCLPLARNSFSRAVIFSQSMGLILPFICRFCARKRGIARKGSRNAFRARFRAKPFGGIDEFGPAFAAYAAKRAIPWAARSGTPSFIAFLPPSSIRCHLPCCNFSPMEQLLLYPKSARLSNGGVLYKDAYIQRIMLVNIHLTRNGLAKSLEALYNLFIKIQRRKFS